MPRAPQSWSDLEVAIVGGGTAGFLATAALAHRFPLLRLLHVHDSTLPPLGVGEGTLPAFARWLEEFTGLDHPELEARCDATFKLGVRFEDWGRRRDVFFNNFSGKAYAYHLSAARLPALLGATKRIESLDRRVERIASDGRHVELHLAGGDKLGVDFAIDARGFPARLGSEHVDLPLPTNAVLLRRGPVAQLQGGTRAVARPHGWIFAIPLAHETSYGYVHNRGLSPGPEVAADLDAFFRQEGVVPAGEGRRLSFPSFRRREFFDGSLLRVGNAASFLEPLEATAIGLIQGQLRVATLWLGDGFVGVAGEEKRRPEVVAEINRRLAHEVDSVALFVAWHYAAGSGYDSVFWRHARLAARSALAAARPSAVGDAFCALRDAAARVSGDWLERVRDPDFLERVVEPALGAEVMAKTLGGFDVLGFAQIGHGLGLLGEQHTEETAQRDSRATTPSRSPRT